VSPAKPTRPRNSRRSTANYCRPFSTESVKTRLIGRCKSFPVAPESRLRTSATVFWEGPLQSENPSVTHGYSTTIAREPLASTGQGHSERASMGSRGGSGMLMGYLGAFDLVIHLNCRTSWPRPDPLGKAAIKIASSETLTLRTPSKRSRPRVTFNSITSFNQPRAHRVPWRRIVVDVTAL
jgi:hypothetical protein